jgi:hypothetical protein
VLSVPATPRRPRRRRRAGRAGRGGCVPRLQISSNAISVHATSHGGAVGTPMTGKVDSRNSHSVTRPLSPRPGLKFCTPIWGQSSMPIDRRKRDLAVADGSGLARRPPQSRTSGSRFSPAPETQDCHAGTIGECEADPVNIFQLSTPPLIKGTGPRFRWPLTEQGCTGSVAVWPMKSVAKSRGSNRTGARPGCEIRQLFSWRATAGLSFAKQGNFARP